MLIVYLSNYLNHHQLPIADELCKLTNKCFYFIATRDIPPFRKKLGYEEYDKSYLIKSYMNMEEYRKAEQLIIDADVVIFGGVSSYPLLTERIKLNKLIIEVGERWLKRGWINLFSPNLLRWLITYYTKFRGKQVFRLCASAYAVNDMKLLGAYKGKCYKWGYFTKVPNIDICKSLDEKISKHTKIKIMWGGRFLKWKHPELAVKVAKYLKERGYIFELNMYGTGTIYTKIEQYVDKLNLRDVVHLHGAVRNEVLVATMQHHDIFLFTSDKNEGWGAVANEAMSNGCILVGSNKIGSIPYLLEDGMNGCIFESGDIDSLVNKVEWLINNPGERKRLAINAYNTIMNIWSPRKASENLIKLITYLQGNDALQVLDGPCSKA